MKMKSLPSSYGLDLQFKLLIVRSGGNVDTAKAVFGYTPEYRKAWLFRNFPITNKSLNYKFFLN